MTKDSYSTPKPTALAAACASQSTTAAAGTLPIKTASADRGSSVSAVSLTAQCAGNVLCIVPVGITLRMDGNVNVAALIVRGSVDWSSSGLCCNNTALQCMSETGCRTTARPQFACSRRFLRADLVISNEFTTQRLDQYSLNR